MAQLAHGDVVRVVQGLGVGVFQVAYADQVVAAMPKHMRGVAGSLIMVTRTAGVVLGALVWPEVLETAGASSPMSAFSSSSVTSGWPAWRWRMWRLST